MQEHVVAGVLVTGLAGLIMGTSAWPIKLMRQYRYEHFGLVSMVFALIVLPWGVTLVSCPHPFAAIGSLPVGILLKANAFSMAWGVAQVLALLCFTRIGVSLTYGILCAIGAGVGVLTPMVLKASGQFADTPGLTSRAGIMVIAGLVVLLAGVFLASLAGFGREKVRQSTKTTATASNNFAIGLAMVVTAGVLSAGWGFAFAYSQGPIIEAMKSQGAGDFAACMAVWALVLNGAAAVNVLYPAWLLSRNASWGILWAFPKEFLFALLYGLSFFVPSILLGHGMLLLGSLGASVGFGLVQGSVILGGQLLGFVSGEWAGVSGRPRKTIYAAILVLMLAMLILSFANGMSAV
jgi:L-rhamnose-H+ transport protein